MKRILPLVFFAFWSVTAFSQTPNSWTRKNDMGVISPNPVTARVEAVGFSIGTKGYLGTGSNATTKLNDFWEYDPATNSWSQKATFPGLARDRAVGFSIGNKGYIGTGQDVANNRLNDFWEYEPATNLWKQKTPFSGTPRKGAVGFSINLKGYIGTGNDINGNKNDFWEYNPATDTWLQKTNFPSARSEAAGFSIGNKGYLGTGQIPNNFYEYDPVSNTWTAKATFPGAAITEIAGFSIGQKGYLSTGRTNPAGITGETYEYNPATNTWTAKINIPPSRYGATAFSIGTKGYIVTGWDISSGYRDDLWEFDPVQPQMNYWIQRADLGGKGRTAAIGFSILNKGYVGGGFDGFYRKDFWEYDPNSDTWSQRAGLPGKSRKAAFGFGIETKGYLGSGLDSVGNGLSDFWEYDPATNRWTEKAQLYTGSTVPFVGFSIGKKGYAYGGSFAANFHQYDPETNTWTLKAVFPGVPREGATALAIGNKGYIGFGNDHVSYRKDFYEYDPATNIWVQKANLPGSNRMNAVGFGLGTKGYIGTGGYDPSGQAFGDFWEYDVATNSWLQKAAVPGSGRKQPVAFTIGARAFLGLGYSNYRYFLQDFYEYTPTTPPTIKDVSISAISGFPLNGCGFTSQHNITVSILNLGSQPETNIPVGCLINGTPLTPAPEIFTGTVAPNATANYTFTVPANLSIAGAYVLKPYTLLSGDNKTTNDTVTFRATNWMLSQLPNYDFEVPALNMPNFRLAPYRYNTIVDLNSGNGKNSIGALFMMQNNFPDPVNLNIGNNAWNTFADRVGGAYLCFNPGGGSATDSLWLTFDLKQNFHMKPSNTNFRVMVNGQQVGPTYNPASAASNLIWTHYKIDLTQHKNASSLEIGFESLLNTDIYNQTFPENVVDNVRVVRRIGNTTGIKPAEKGSTFNLYPNPATESFTVVSTEETQQLQMIDLNGKVIKEQVIKRGENQITLPHTAKGIYLVKLISEDGIQVKKLIVQ